MFTGVIREALSSLFVHPLRSLLTLLSVAFGSAVLMVLLSYATAVPETTEAVLRSLGGKEFIVEPRRSRGMRGAGNRHGRTIRIRYADLPAIREACPSVSGMAPAYGTGRGGPVFSSDRSWPWARVTGVGVEYSVVTDMQILDGRWFTKEEELNAEDVALISRPLVEGMFDGSSAIGRTIDANGRRFEIIGMYESKAQFAYSLFVPYPTAMEMGDGGGRHVSHIAFHPRRPDLARDAIDEIRTALGTLYSFDPYDESALDIKENTSFVEKVEAVSLGLEGLVITIAGMALVLGCLGAANVVGIAVSERTGELGLRKALGATPKRIRAEVLSETLLLCIAGGLLGALIGSLAIAALGPLEFTDAAVLVPRSDRSLFAIGSVTLVLTAALAGLPAANRAARLDPAAALRDA